MAAAEAAGVLGQADGGEGVRRCEDRTGSGSVKLVWRLVKMCRNGRVFVGMRWPVLLMR